MVEGEQNIWLDAANSNYDNWINNSLPQSGCAVVVKLRRDLSKWLKVGCDITNEVVCKKTIITTTTTEAPTTTTTTTETPTTSTETPETCDEEWTLFGRRCFRLFKHKFTFNEAEVFCRSYDGDMASIHSEDENNFILDMARNENWLTHHIWLGGKRITEYTDFDWTDSSTRDYKPVLRFVRDTDKLCVASANWPDYGNYWNYQSCYSQYASFCVKTAIKL